MQLPGVSSDNASAANSSSEHRLEPGWHWCAISRWHLRYSPPHPGTRAGAFRNPYARVDFYWVFQHIRSRAGPSAYTRGGATVVKRAFNRIRVYRSNHSDVHVWSGYPGWRVGIGI